MSSLIDHAKREIAVVGDLGYDGMIEEAVLQLLQVFADQGHSGFSASLTTDLFSRLARYEPLAPLTGEDSEWNEVTGGTFQNNRCSHVFKQADRFDGQAYDLNGKVFRQPDGACYTGNGSMAPITFPYVPKTEYVDVPE